MRWLEASLCRQEPSLLGLLVIGVRGQKYRELVFVFVCKQSRLLCDIGLSLTH